MKLLSVIIPAYNEEEAIKDTLQEVKKAVQNLKGYNCEILVINNNSTDKTEEIARTENETVLFEQQQGYGYAYKKGLHEAKGDVIITGDADGSYPFYEIPRFLALMDEGQFDFISTNRFAHLEKDSMPLTNHVGNYLLTFFTNIIYGVKVKDSQSGMIICNRTYLDRVQLEILSNGMPLCQELKLYALFLKVKFTEVPINYRKRIGNVKLRRFIDGGQNFLRLFQFKQKLKTAFHY